ncbi:DNA-binding protein [Streptomyces cylindrosporus]|uniref:DNA-binding protein n=1 Tax=Streptomyces cylindrosporus TaxID=2927583 RepID=A0ABS9YKG4_9ACTN|nr:DNA-binding protein [Streptomyces cylindrosporus]MCI3277674.1 DNA-binding protein [Streptomyces cylindrosporus]
MSRAKKPPTLAEVRGWPATVSIPEAAAAMGIGKTTLYDQVNAGAAPVRVLPISGVKRVVTASLVRLLETGNADQTLSPAS